MAMKTKNDEYHVSVEIKYPADTTDDALDRGYDRLLDSDTLLAPVMSDNAEDHTIGLTYNVEAKSPQAAIKAGLAELCAVLGCKDGLASASLVSMKAVPYVDPDLLELVSQAEIARRLDVSREWVRQLAARDDFPSPILPQRARSGLYRWGEIKEWNEAVARRTGRPKAA